MPQHAHGIGVVVVGVTRDGYKWGGQIPGVVITILRAPQNQCLVQPYKNHDNIKHRRLCNHEVRHEHAHNSGQMSR